jgi:hypothetical protein
MAKLVRFDKGVLDTFEAQYDTSHEDSALQTRGQFIEKFPSKRLRSLTLDDYVVGHQTPSFCNFVESKTRAWANIQGATSRKFGIYFGRSKSDPTIKYRFTEKFGTSKDQAFEGVKAALLDLVRLGGEAEPDFRGIDGNPLSQMFKAKILSLYFPERFLAVCSAEHLEMLGETLGFADSLPASQYQNLLIDAKSSNGTTRAWSYPKFMAFLYKMYVRSARVTEQPIEKPRKKSHRRVDFEDMQKLKDEIGKLAEEFALKWEKQRLIGAGLEHLIAKIEDRRNYPGYGHDFLSHTGERQARFIEVKSVAWRDEAYRFFLSDNEHKTSLSSDHAPGYYFYMVFFDGKKQPSSVMAMLADQLYADAELTPASYVVRFDLREAAKSH